MVPVKMAVVHGGRHMDLPQAGHHGKEVGNVYSIKKCDKKSNRIFCWITYPLSSGAEKSTDYRGRTAVAKRCS